MDTSKESRISEIVKIICVIGGPGAGKGTQCARLAQDFNIAHISIGDLLRAEQHHPHPQGPLSSRAEAIRAHYVEGKDLNDDIYVDVLQEHLRVQIQNGQTNFIVDGFPRNIYQTGCFERCVSIKIQAIIFFHCPEDEMLKRVLHRSHTSGRADDTETAFRRRYRRFMNRAEVVLEFYRGVGILFQINSNLSIEEIYTQLRPIVQKAFTLS